jgi:5-enolpyruvylshikimate-3-phosphate synthase
MMTMTMTLNSITNLTSEDTNDSVQYCSDLNVAFADEDTEVIELKDDTTQETQSSNNNDELKASTTTRGLTSMLSFHRPM